ncbi:MAG: selenium cofactor biosynthesis protein YqeC [Pseudomonadota bacterium]
MTCLWDALGIRVPHLVALVGAGGKTGLMFRLARLAAARGIKTLACTTTRIFFPDPEQSPLTILEDEVGSLVGEIERNFKKFNPITAARSRLPQGKLAGLTPETVDRLFSSGIPDLILVEGDGARGNPLKAPGTHEPVIPSLTRLVIPVAGLSGLGRPLDERTVFRPEIFAVLGRVPPGSPVTCDSVARVLTHSRGFLGKSPPNAGVVPFLNQADAIDPETAAGLAGLIMGQSAGRVRRVVWGSLAAPGDDFHILTS